MLLVRNQYIRYTQYDILEYSTLRRDSINDEFAIYYNTMSCVQPTLYEIRHTTLRPDWTIHTRILYYFVLYSLNARNYYFSVHGLTEITKLSSNNTRRNYKVTFEALLQGLPRDVVLPISLYISLSIE